MAFVQIGGVTVTINGEPVTIGGVPRARMMLRVEPDAPPEQLRVVAASDDEQLRVEEDLAP